MKQSWWRHLIALTAGICVCSCLLGCGKKANTTSFQNVKEGMTYEEVVGVLGDPTDWKSKSMSAGGTSMMIHDWVSGDKVFIVTFMNNKVQGTVATSKEDYADK